MMIFADVKKNIRAFFRINAFLITTTGLYAVWLTGRFFASDKLD